MQASRKTGALQLYEVKVDLGDLQRCLQAEGQLFVQDSAETLLCYTQLHFVARMLTCNGACVCVLSSSVSVLELYGNFSATSLT